MQWLSSPQLPCSRPHKLLVAQHESISPFFPSQPTIHSTGCLNSKFKKLFIICKLYSIWRAWSSETGASLAVQPVSSYYKKKYNNLCFKIFCSKFFHILQTFLLILSLLDTKDTVNASLHDDAVIMCFFSSFTNCGLSFENSWWHNPKNTYPKFGHFYRGHTVSVFKG